MHRPAAFSAIVLRIIHRLEEWVIAALLAAMTLLTFVQVVLRYVFNSGLIWALEATTYLFGWLILIGISYGIRTNAHIGVDVLVAMLPRPLRRAAGLLGVALCALYAGFMIYGSWIYVDRMMILDVEAEDIPLPRWLLGIILPIGFGLLLLRLIPVAYRILVGKQDMIGLADEKAETTGSELLTRGIEGEIPGR